MSLFVIDTVGDKDLEQNDTQYYKSTNKLVEGKPRVPVEVNWCDDDEEDDAKNQNNDVDDLFCLPPPSVDLSAIIQKTLRKTTGQMSQAELQMDRANEAYKMASEKKSTHKLTERGRISNIDHSDFNPRTKKYMDDANLQVTDVQKELKTSAMQSNFETLKGLPNIRKRKQRDLDRVERATTKGAGWFNLPAQELTEEVENDLKILQMRSVLDPKHFYKKNDLKVLPKYFQVGTVQHSPLDHYQERDTRRNKKKSLVDELLADNEALQYTKRKYKEIMVRKDKYAHRKAMKKMKKTKKNK